MHLFRKRAVGVGSGRRVVCRGKAPVFPQGGALPDVKISQQVFWIMRTGPKERSACRRRSSRRPTPEKFHFAASLLFCGCLRPAIRLPARRRIYKALSETRREETGASSQNSGKARKCENCPDKEGSPRQFLLSASAAPAACGRLRLCKMPCLEVCLLVLQGFSSPWRLLPLSTSWGEAGASPFVAFAVYAFFPKGRTAGIFRVCRWPALRPGRITPDAGRGADFKLPEESAATFEFRHIVSVVTAAFCAFGSSGFKSEPCQER